MARKLGRAKPDRIMFWFVDDDTGTTPIPLPTPRTWPAGLVVGAMFVVFAGIAWGQIDSMRGQQVDTVFDLTTLLFQGFWVLGWSVGVIVLFLLTVLLLFYRESARIIGHRLVHIPRIGPVHITLDYDLYKVRDLRAVMGRGDKVRIRFTYRGGRATLGNEMPRADAEERVRVIQSAIAALPPAQEEQLGTADASDLHAEPAPTDEPQPSASPSSSVSSLALVAANLVPLAGIVLLGWDLGQIMTLFWAENAVIGFYSLLKLGIAAKWKILIVGPFFIAHFGAFMSVHFLFIYSLFVTGIDGLGSEPGVAVALADLFVPLWPALLALFLSHGISFVANYLRRGEYRRLDLEKLMGDPYKRVVLLHVTLIVGGWTVLLLGNPGLALLLLIALKTAMDLRAHRKEHGSAHGW